MKDIRKDLQERLKAIELRRERIQDQLKGLEERESVLHALLQEEEAEWQSQQPTLLEIGEIPTLKPQSELTKFIITTLNDNNPHRLDDLVRLAQQQGVFVKGKTPRRAIHFSLVGLKQSKRVEMVDHGVWKICQNGGGEA